MIKKSFGDARNQEASRKIKTTLVFNFENFNKNIKIKTNESKNNLKKIIFTSSLVVVIYILCCFYIFGQGDIVFVFGPFLYELRNPQ